MSLQLSTHPAAPAPPLSGRPRALAVARRADALAALVAEGKALHVAGQELGLTRGETASAWRRVCRDLGAQAV